MENSKKQKTMKIVKLVVNIIFYAIIVLLLLFAISNLTKKDQFEVPSIFGSGFSTVLSPSMDGNLEKGDSYLGNESIKVGSFTIDDLLYVKKINDRNRTKMAKKLVVGDVITFKWYDESKSEYILNTHRIKEIALDEDGEIQYFTTKGDKAFMTNNVQEETVNVSDLRAVVTGVNKGAGKTMKFLQSSNGFLICIVLPTALFFIFEALMIVLNVAKIKQDKANKEHEEEMANMQARLEEEKAQERERIRAEILAEEAKKKEEENK